MQTNRQHDQADKPERGPKPVTIGVNGQQVEMPKGEASGAEIKQAAIAAGVAIAPDFTLFLSGKDGLEPVRDDETVRLKKGLEFRAVAPDDVS
jgi:ABC-type transporter Mla maintaining outer membrane lipid asymmetry ATPase subunit MlaF